MSSTDSSAVSTSVCQTALIPGTVNSWKSDPPNQITLGISKLIILLILLKVISS